MRTLQIDKVECCSTSYSRPFAGAVFVVQVKVVEPDPLFDGSKLELTRFKMKQNLLPGYLEARGYLTSEKVLEVHTGYRLVELTFITLERWRL